MFPSTITQNTTISFSTTGLSDYIGWTLTYSLNSTYSISAVVDSDGVATFLENDTNWIPNFYNVQGAVSNGISRYIIEQCKTQVLSDLSTVTDSTSHVKKVLDAIEATILKTASKEQESYTIAGRALKYKSIDELLKLRDKYRQEWIYEQKACAVANGTFKNKQILVRFN